MKMLKELFEVFLSERFIFFNMIYALVSCCINLIFIKKIKKLEILRKLSSWWVIAFLVVVMIPLYVIVLHYILGHFWSYVVYFALVYMIVTGIILKIINYFKKKKDN